jgi:site-specific recombinase XerD
VPSRRPKEPTPFVPHIYTQEELRRLLDGTTTYQKKWYKLEPVSLRAILLLLYGAGLRVSEAINLTCADVNLPDAILTIRLTKFYKTRHVAINAQLCCVLSDYDINRRTKRFCRDTAAPFFIWFHQKRVRWWIMCPSAPPMALSRAARCKIVQDFRPSKTL